MKEKEMKRAVAAAFMLVCTAAGMPALAAEAGEKTITLDKVVVSASRIEEKAKNVTQSVTVIPREEIEKNQYKDVADLLRNRGIQVDSYSPNSSLSQVSMRGVRTSCLGTHGLDGKILIMVDGRRVGTDNISMIPLVNVDRIEIVRGPAAVQYGTSAIGGVINVITRRGTETPALMAEIGLGSWDTYKAQASAAWAKGPFDSSGGVSYNMSNGYKYGDNKRFHNTDVNYKTAYSLNAGVNFLDEHRIGVTMLGIRADAMGSPGYYDDVKDEYTDRATYSFDINYEGGHKDAGLSWKTMYFNGANNYLSDERFNAGGSQYFKSDTNYQGAQGQVTFSKGFLTLTGGTDWSNYDTRFWGAYYSPHEHSEYDDLGFFAIAKLAFFDERLILSGGLRYDEYIMKVQGEDQDLYNNTSSAGIALHPTDWLTFRGNYGESYRVPQAIELIGFKGMYTYLGTPDLKPEKAKTLDAGFEINHKSLNFGMTYFRSNYKRMITAAYPPSWDIMYVNQEGKTKLRGIEAFAAYDIGEAFDWNFSLRPYVNLTRMLKNRDPDGKKTRNISDLDLAYGIGFSHPKIGLDMDLSFTYYGKQDQQDWNMNSDTNGEVVEVGGRTIVDFFIAQTLHEWNDAGKLSLKAEIRNIADDKYATIKDYPLPGRSFYLGLRYDY
jgi:vitamin B12 transporter